MSYKLCNNSAEEKNIITINSYKKTKNKIMILLMTQYGILTKTTNMLIFDSWEKY